MFRRTVPAIAVALWFLLAVAAAAGEVSNTSGDGDNLQLCNANILPDPQSLRSDQLTVLINGFSEARLPLLRSLAVSYSSLPFVAAVLVLWGNPSVPSRKLEVLSASGAGSAPISVLRQPTSSLNARFLPRREIRTRAVAVCDDDVEIDETSLRLAFDVWGTNRDRIVGFFARSHELDLSQRTWIYTVHPNRYSIMLTKFMILGTEYLFRYSCGGGERMRSARKLVDSERNCEDILMNFVVAMETRSGPLLVGGRRIRDLGDVRNDEGSGKRGKRIKDAGSEKKAMTEIKAVGLSAMVDHRKRRGDCIREFHRILGAMPLRYSYGKLVKDVGEQALCKKAGKLVLCDAQ